MAVALIGTLSSTVYLGLVLAAGAEFRADSRELLFPPAADGDVEAAPNYLREVVAALLKPDIAMSTCLYRGKNVGDFWSNQTAMLMSVEEPAGALVANLLEGMKFGLGPTIAVRKEALEKIGGGGKRFWFFWRKIFFCDTSFKNGETGAL